jgi:hypothetical protein
MRHLLAPAASLCLLAPVNAAERLDLAPFARPCCAQDDYRLQTTFDYQHPRGVVQAADGRFIYGLQWAEERDLFEIAVFFRQPYDAKNISIQYWFSNWPPAPPRMPTIEDPVDDPWQGRWLTAKTEAFCQQGQCRFTFLPLDEAENPLARNLSGVRYRRAIKFRIVFPPGSRPDLETVQVFSESTLRPVTLWVETPGKPSFRAYNGSIRQVKPSTKGAWITVDTADPQPAGSLDVTVVEVRNGEKSFAFAPAEVSPGGMHVPDCGAFIRLENDPAARPAVRKGARIRERLEVEPEQTLERATREIPPLDPVERQGGRLYLPLAADSSWQKFAVEWGGNVFISKRATKAKGRELERLTWPGDRLSWRIGTGAVPSFRPRAEDSTLGMLDDHLPVAIARWSSGSVEYEEEAFATLLRGPLDPADPARSEQTPAALLVRITARNRSAAAEDAHLWLGMDPEERLAFDGALLTAGEGRWVRAAVHPPQAASARLENAMLHLVHRLKAGEESITHLALPFIAGLDAAERRRLAELDYATERSRTVEYWSRIAERAVPFEVPEPRFNSFARGLPARIRISVTKDPKSGVFIVPAASYAYQMYANEAAFQAHWLDLAGMHETARLYLDGLVALQGSKPFAGTYTGDQKAVYHGARIDDEYDYTAHQYNLDHGTVLWILAEHYFITRDRGWLERTAPSMKRAARWILEQRKLTQVMVDGEPCPEYGLLPAGHLEDNRDWGHWFSVNAYASLGIESLARALADAGDPEAALFAKESLLYREDLRRAVLRAAAAAPAVRLRDNTWVPYVPTRVHQRIRLFGPARAGFYSRYPEKALPTFRLSATRELLYGPLILLETGVFDVREPLAEWVLDDWEDNATMSEPLGLHVHGWVDEEFWFSRGGMVFQPNLQNPIRAYVRRGEARAAIRALYNNFVSCYYPQVNIFTEEYRQWRSPSGPFYKTPDEAKFVHRLRDMLVTELGEDLLLATAAPERWLAPGQQIRAEAAPTHFGPVSYTLRGGEGEVRGSVELPQRNPYRDAWLSIRVPGARRIASVAINGRPWKEFDPARSRIRLPRSDERLEIQIRLR